MRESILSLIEKEYVVLDGGMGTLLQAMGLTPDELPEEWNISRPEAVSGVHLDYLEAGAQIIETNTFGASPMKMSLKGKEKLVDEVNRRGVECARGALKRFTSGEEGAPSGPDRGSDRFVGGSVGPSGKILDMDASAHEMERSYAAQAVVLAAEGVDLFLVETMIDLREAELAVSVLKRETGFPVFASLVFNRNKKGELRTLFGNAPGESALLLLDAGASAVGANCGLVEEYVQAVREMRAVTDAPLTLYPNAGLPILKDGKTVFKQSAGDLIRSLDDEITAGATIIGGCCGTTPDYICLISAEVRGKKRSV